MICTTGAAEGTHSAFALLTGLGVAAALMLLRWFPQPRIVAFVLVPIAVTVPIAMLAPSGRRTARAHHSAVSRGVAAFAATAVATGIAILASWIGTGMMSLIDPDSRTVEAVEFAVVAASTGISAGWLAGQFDRWVDRDGGRLSAQRTLRNPWSWGVPGVAGASIFLAMTMFPAWTFVVISEGGGFDPGGAVALWYSQTAMTLGILSAVIGLVLEATMCWRKERQPVKTPLK